MQSIHVKHYSIQSPDSHPRGLTPITSSQLGSYQLQEANDGSQSWLLKARLTRNKSVESTRDSYALRGVVFTALDSLYYQEMVVLSPSSDLSYMPFSEP